MRRSHLRTWLGHCVPHGSSHNSNTYVRHTALHTHRRTHRAKGKHVCSSSESQTCKWIRVLSLCFAADFNYRGDGLGSFSETFQASVKNKWAMDWTGPESPLGLLICALSQTKQVNWSLAMQIIRRTERERGRNMPTTVTAVSTATLSGIREPLQTLHQIQFKYVCGA